MSFVGGGSDLPSYYRAEGCGAVISTAIDKYIYVNVNRKFDDGIRVAYSAVEEVESLAEIKHPIVKAVMELGKLEGGVEITTIADIPSRGTGLGSSSAFTVGLLNCLAAYQGRYMSAADLGAQACQVEIEMCGEPIGKQDQYASAFGGFNVIEFRDDERVDVTPVLMRVALRDVLERRIIVFYTGVTRSASAVLREQGKKVAQVGDARRNLRRMVELVYELKRELEGGNLDSFGEILHENWELKKSLTSGISNDNIETWYGAARAAGARGGKILGAGAGGFLMFYAEEDRHEAIARSLPNLKRIHFGFDPLGSRVIFYNPSRFVDEQVRHEQ
jgi:D-glycero-alpha-D-manno-heptose-7-phosphate kinase